MNAGMRRQGILADDLTGAGDTALQFYEEGREVWIVPELHEGLPRRASTLALNVESRHLGALDAATRVDQAGKLLLRWGCTDVYKKVDSTLRGNLGLEALQALRTLDLDMAVVAPAFPQAGRITAGGYQLVDGVPVNVSVYGADPVTPVTQAHLPSLLAEQGGADLVGMIGLQDVMRGPEAIAGQLVRAMAARQRLIAVDATRPEDLAAIARAIALVPYRLLPVGSAGLARAIAAAAGRGRLLDAPAGGPPVLGGLAPVLAIAGSLNPVTRQQVEVARPHARVIELDVAALLLTDGAAVDAAVAQARPWLLARQDVILTTAAGDQRRHQERALARDLAMGSMQVAQHVAQALGRVAARLAADAELAGLVLAGGDTALGVCRAMGNGRAQAMKVAGELLPAVPLLRLESGLRVVTKSGGFGGPDALLELPRRLKRQAP